MLNQVNKILFTRNLLRQYLRYTHRDHNVSNILYPLRSKRLLKVAGDEAAVFLQGLITNDMRHFDNNAKSIYAMFLNNKGRVLYDTIIYRTDDAESFLIECDKNISSQLLRHLKLFKLKRKIEIADASLELKVWALIASTKTSSIGKDPIDVLKISKDPRLSELGYRILSPASLEESDITSIIGDNVCVEKCEDGYKMLRYKLGVSEGPEDLPPGSSFPLEANCDYLHGVSFHKGCYIGQELTARVHHTGVVRKRIMPLIFSEYVDDMLPDSVISDSSKPKSNVGKLKGVIKNYGIGLIRIKDALEAAALVTNNYTVKIMKPSWWPQEAPKEKAGLNKLITE